MCVCITPQKQGVWGKWIPTMPKALIAVLNSPALTGAILKPLTSLFTSFVKEFTAGLRVDLLDRS